MPTHQAHAWRCHMHGTGWPNHPATPAPKGQCSDREKSPVIRATATHAPPSPSCALPPASPHPVREHTEAIARAPLCHITAAASVTRASPSSRISAASSCSPLPPASLNTRMVQQTLYNTWPFACWPIPAPYTRNRNMCECSQSFA